MFYIVIPRISGREETVPVAARNIPMGDVFREMERMTIIVIL